MSFNIKSQYSAILSIIIIITMYFKDTIIHMDTLFCVLKPIFIILAFLGIIIVSIITILFPFVKEIDNYTELKKKYNKSKLYNYYYVAIESATFAMSVVAGEKFIATLVLIRFIVVEIFKNIIIRSLLEKESTDEKAQSLEN